MSIYKYSKYFWVQCLCSFIDLKNIVLHVRISFPNAINLDSIKGIWMWSYTFITPVLLWPLTKFEIQPGNEECHSQQVHDTK